MPFSLFLFLVSLGDHCRLQRLCRSSPHCLKSLVAQYFGEGNGNPLQCSCLENPRDGEPGGLPSMGSQSRTRLEWLSSTVLRCVEVSSVGSWFPVDGHWDGRGPFPLHSAALSGSNAALCMSLSFMTKPSILLTLISSVDLVSSKY